MTLAKSFDAWAQQHEQKGLERGIEKRIEKGIEKGIEQGIEKGIIKGETLLLQRLLTKRFGPLPDHAAQQIESATVGQIDVWIDRVLDAQSLDDVLRVS